MLCVNGYSQEFINQRREQVHSQLESYRALIANVKDNAAIEAFEAHFFNNMLLVLDNLFVNRSRTMEKKDGNPLNELRTLVNSLLNNDGIMLEEKSVKLDPKKSVLGFKVGDEIRLNEAQFVAIFHAFFAEIEAKFLDTLHSPQISI
jgi:hypothetical protein